MRDEFFGGQRFDCPRITGGYRDDQGTDGAAEYFEGHVLKSS